MNWWDRTIVPRLINRCCNLPPLVRQREKVVPYATGLVLELGFGSGLNLPFYNRQQVRCIYALEPSEEIVALAAERMDGYPIPIELIQASAEDIPLPNACADTVVATYVLCTVPDIEAALAEVRRVLKPDGIMLFSEHIRAPDASVARWQDRLNPLWKKLAGGCNMNRDTLATLTACGFELQPSHSMYLPGPRALNYHSWGAAYPQA